MIASLAKLIDWLALQTGELVSPPDDRRNPRLAEAIEFLNSPDFLAAPSPPSQLEFDSPENFRFRTPRPCAIAENNFAFGRLFRRGPCWEKNPAVILLHGGNPLAGGKGSLSHRLFPRIARRFNAAGFNAATLLTPYHFQRLPRDSAALRSLDYLRVAETFSQAVAEIRALTGWLLEQGCPAVALWGVSLGGWRAGLAACCDARLAAVVLAVPGVCMNHLSLHGEKVVWPRVRQMMRERRAEHEALDRTPLNLISSQPVIPRENILLIEGRYDVIVASGPVEQLWNAWSRPEIWRLAHGHLSWMGVPSVADRILHWLTPRLSANAIEQARS
jgi:hypothetical protein